MGRRVGPPRTITVVVPKHGTPAAPHSLLKAVSATVKKQNPRAQFQEQDPITSSELQEFVSISYSFYNEDSKSTVGGSFKLERIVIKCTRRTRTAVGCFWTNVR